MKVIVLGGGVIGVTTAYYLARAGAEVTVIDRQRGPAQETSFANAGQVSPGYSTPWAAPGIPLKALKWMFQKHAPLSIRPDGSLFQLRWMAQMLRNCSPERYARQQGTHDARRRVQPRLPARTARRDRHPLRAAHPGHAAAVPHPGAARCGAARHRRAARNAACPTNCSTAPARARRAGPGAHAATCSPAACACRTTRPATATCSPKALADIARGLGVDFRFDQSVDGLVTEGGRITGVRLGGATARC